MLTLRALVEHAPLRNGSTRAPFANLSVFAAGPEHMLSGTQGNKQLMCEGNVGFE